MNRSAIRVISLILCAFMLIPCFTACSKDGEDSETASAKITAINMFFLGDVVELSVGEKSSKMHITVTSEGNFSHEMIEFISEDESIATVNYESTTLTSFIYFTVVGVGAGETDIYFKAADGDVASDRIHVVVRGDKPDTTAADTTSATVTEAATTEEAPAAAVTDIYTSSPDTAPVPVSDAAPVYAPEPTGRTVYTTPSGKKYHYSASCAGGNATPVDEGTAVLNYEPCKKCAGGDPVEPEYVAPSVSDSSNDSAAVYNGTTVYITPTGKKYHLSASCAGKNATPTTKESAEKTYEPCKKCAQ